MFANINTTKLAKTLNIGKLAKQAAQRDCPETEALELDDAQQAIVEHFQDCHQQASQSLEQTLQNNRQQLRELEKQMDTSRGDVMVDEAQQAVKCINANHHDTMASARLAERQNYQDLQAFKQTHALTRAARYPESKIFHWALVIVAIVLESIANSYFFAKGSDFGLIGGTIQAAMISLVNIGSALLAGLFLLPQFNHIDRLRKAFAGLASMLFMMLIILFGLTTAHYRAQLEIDPINALNQTIPALLQAPFAITNFDAWILFVIGILFALFALYKGYTADDVYPGYGEIDRHYQAINQQYEQQKQQLRIAINECLANKLSELEQLVNTIHQSASEYSNLVAQSEHLIKTYQQYISQCEKACNQLLKQYRDTNTQYRHTEPPTYFAKIFLFDSQYPTELDWQKERELADNFSWLITDLEAQAAQQRIALQQLNAEVLNTVKNYVDEVEQNVQQQLAIEQPIIEQPIIEQPATKQPIVDSDHVIE